MSIFKDIIFLPEEKEDGQGYETVDFKRLELPMKQFIFLKFCVLLRDNWLFTLCLSCYCSYLLVQKNMDVWVSCLSWTPQVLEWKEMEEISKRLKADHCNRSNSQTL